MALLRDKDILIGNIDQELIYHTLNSIYCEYWNTNLDINKLIITPEGVSYKGNLSVRRGLSDTIETLQIPGINIIACGGNFDCSYCRKLKDLKGSPRIIRYEFNCSNCDNLETLEGGPEVVDKFICNGTLITSLRYSPCKCRVFNCSYCDGLKNLKCAPHECQAFNCSNCNNLETLEGAPSRAEYFNCSGCINITSLKGGPTEGVKIYYCDGCRKLKFLEDAPSSVKDVFYSDTHNYQNSSKFIPQHDIQY